MDIQKEKEAFKTWFESNFESPPDGFVLVKEDDLDFIKDLALSVQAKCARLNNDSDRIFSDIEDIQLSAERLLEAQEPVKAQAAQEKPCPFNLDEFLAVEEKLKHKGGVIAADLDRFIAYAEMVLEKAKAPQEQK